MNPNSPVFGIMSTILSGTFIIIIVGSFLVIGLAFFGRLTARRVMVGRVILVMLLIPMMMLLVLVGIDLSQGTYGGGWHQ